jgi:hypothetical protein
MKDMINKSIEEAFTSTDPKMVELRSQMLLQAGVQLPQSQAIVPSSSSTRGLRRYPVDDIMESRTFTLLIPVGHKMTRKKEVAMGQVLPPKSNAMYNNRLIPPNYARVEVTWTHDDFEEEEIDFPTKEGARNIRGILGYIVLWNKKDIVLDMMMPRS